MVSLFFYLLASFKIFLFIWKEIAQERNRYHFARIKLEILFLHSTPSEYKRNILKWFYFPFSSQNNFHSFFILLILFTIFNLK